MKPTTTRLSLGLLFAFVLLSTLSLQGNDWYRDLAFFPENQEALYAAHPNVALPPAKSEGAVATTTALLSPEPNQLRVQDLRGVECYPQPDRLEVCGAADTTCVLLFTKSVERLPEIEMTLRFGEGIEYGGFAEINYSDEAVFPPPLTDLDEISVQNPEAPSFLISGVTRDSGAVYVCFGIRAECGVDLNENPPFIEFEWRYTTEAGVFCEGSYTPPNSFAGNVITPRVQFTSPFPPNRNLGAPGGEVCQPVRITQTTPDAGADGYIFTASDYGFDEGIQIARVARNGITIPEADYTIGADGMLTYIYAGEDGPLLANEIDVINVCYTYDECFPNVDFTPVYTVVSACDGEVCTGPADEVRNGRLISDFNFAAALTLDYSQDMLTMDAGFTNNGAPSICGDDPYVFDLVASATNSTDIVGDVTSLVFRLRSCSSPLFNLSSVDVIDEATNASVGQIDLSNVRVLSEADEDEPLDVAGTVFVDLRGNETVSGGNLVDIDGDGAFDDLEGGTTLRLRLTYDITCTADDAAGVTAPAAGESVNCQFSDISVSGRRGCEARTISQGNTSTGAEDYTVQSTSSFSNEPDAFNSRTGYNFGFIGNLSSCNTRPAVTENFVFSYNLGSSTFTDCPAGSSPEGELIITIVGDSRITNDAEFTNFGFDNDGDGVADVMITDPADTSSFSPQEGTRIFTLRGGAAAAATGTDLAFTFDVTLDTAYCSPFQLLIISGLINVDCGDGCECGTVTTSSVSNLRVDPEDCECDCYLSQSTEVTRISRGFTDETRTTQVPELDQADPDNLRLLAGDTIELRTGFTILPEAANSTRFDGELGNANRTVAFEVSLRTPTNGFNSTNTDQFPLLLDYQLSRLLSFKLFRNGETIDIAALYSGPSQSNTIPVRLGSGGTNANNDFPQDGEIIQPAFPNGGYVFNQGDDDNNDDRDGIRLIVELQREGVSNRVGNAIDILYDEIGSFLPGDSIETIWRTVVIDNPGQVDPVGAPIPATFTPFHYGSSFIGDPANGIFAGYSLVGCPQVPTSVEFFFPEVQVSSVVDYEENCGGEAIFTFTNTQPAADWYTDEFRPVTGLEQIELDLPFPYAFAGGATAETSNGIVIPIMLDESSDVDTVSINGQEAYLPSGGSGSTGRLVFTDAEFADSVRADGYANFDLGENDITTVGGTFPLIGVGGDRTDEVIIRVPIVKLCGEAPTSALSATYNWANRHLPDYEDFPYRRNFGRDPTNYWDGKVEANDGNPPVPATDPGFNSAGNVTPSIQFYFPFQRLQDDDTDQVNPHRRIDEMTTYTIVDQPAALTASVTNNSGSLIVDGGGTETTNLTIAPGPGQTLAGVIAISVGEGGQLVGVTSNGAALMTTQVGFQNGQTIFSVAIPDGLAAGESLPIAVETDLLFCAPAEFCVTPIPGCTEDINVQLATAFEIDCGGSRECFNYSGGTPSVATTITDPLELGLCETQTFNVQYFNDGTADLSNFSPVIFIPEGLDVSNFSFTTTGNPAGGPLTAPTYDASDDGANEVFGEGRTFTQAEIDAALATNGLAGFNPGQVLTISFEGRTTCDFTSGLPLVSIVRSTGVCMDELEEDFVFSQNINVALPAQPQAIFNFEVDDQPLEISCSEDGDRLIVTAANVGKAEGTTSEICVRLPNGVSIDVDRVQALTPTGFVLTEEDVTTTPINGGGDVQQCFTAPNLAPGAFVCLEIPFVVEDIDCGPVFIGATVLNETETGCANPGAGDTDPCTIKVSTTEMQYFELEVVAAVTANNANLSANCTGTPGVFDVVYDFEFLAESQPYNGNVTLQLFSDVDANGEFDPTIDTQIGSDQMVAVSLQQDESEMFTGVFPGVNQDEICPLLLRIESLGCTCSESILSFPQVLPDFIDDLGESVVLCPGEPFTFEGVCADLTYNFVPPEAGLVTIDENTGEATITLNPGFGVEEAVDLRVQGGFGSCALEQTISVSSPGTVGFGPYTYSVCNVGRQEVDLNIPLDLQEDITVEILDPVGISNPNSVEPIIEDLQEDRVYDVIFSFNDGSCMEQTILEVTVEEAIVVEIEDFTGCQTGFNLSDRITVTPATAEGKFQTDGDGTFSPDNDIPGEVNYTPGPMEIEQGFVRLRYNSDTPEGPCGPTTERLTVTILLVDCGSFFWDGE